MRYALILLWMLFLPVTSANAQLSIGIGLPGVSIGINLPLYPELVRVPGYPVYYAPRLNSNYFFYDGMFWVYQRDNWYASYWYNGPWGLVAAEGVPLFVLRIPVRYYRSPPPYFRGWRADAPPRWGEHWGHDWERNRSGWDKWNRASVPAAAPPPVYQRQYSGDRYPQVEQQRALHGQNYRYQPRDPVVRQHYQEQVVQRAPAPAQRGQQAAPRERSSTPQQGSQGRNAPAPAAQGNPAVTRSQPPQKGDQEAQRSAPTQAPPQQKGSAARDNSQQPRQGAAPREQQTPRKSQEKNPQDKGASREQQRGQGQDKGREIDQQQGQGRNK